MTSRTRAVLADGIEEARSGLAQPGTRREFVWGLVGVGIVVVLLLASALTYLVPFGERTYRATISDASAIRVGDDVRVAGISVGKVRDVTLHDTNVELEFSVESDVRLGRETGAAVRMLTAVGGYYLAVLPAGSGTLEQPIPSDRVELPYRLTELFQDASSTVSDLDVSGAGPAIRSTIDIVDEIDSKSAFAKVRDLAELMKRQSVTLTQTLHVADDLTGFLAQSRGTILSFLQELAALEGVVRANGNYLIATVEQAGGFFARLANLAPIYHEELVPVLAPISTMSGDAERVIAQLAKGLSAIRDRIDQLRGLLSDQGGLQIDNSGVTLASDICIPLPGRAC